MLSRLIIQNYAIISELDITLLPGLTVITGETGAGKSILLGALGLALGRRADNRIVSPQETKCIIEAHFEIRKDDSLKEIFEREGLDYDRHLICRREISSTGKNRTFVNDTPVHAKLLQEITNKLIELHQQNDNLALQSKDNQIHTLDVLSNSMPEFKKYQELYKKMMQQKAELIQLREVESSASRKRDFLTFQINELDEAHLLSGEAARLEEKLNVLKHAEEINVFLSTLSTSLNHGQHSLLSQVQGLSKQIESIKKISPAFSEIGQRLEAFRIEIQDLSLEVSKMDAFDQYDPVEISRSESRLNQLFNLFKKYHVKNDDELIELNKNFKQELNDLTTASEQIEILEKKIEASTSALFEQGKNLSKLRQSGAKKVSPRINSLIADLGMPNGRFSIEVKALQDLRPDGLDDIAFLFSANKGMPMQPIQSVASGGELSRLSLALKSLYAVQAELPTIIFDEIDTGISGEVAWRMGQLIRTLAKGHQILMITHSPQIAAHADTQYHVSKRVVDGKDTSFVQVLTKDLRFVEIAKMLSGDPPSSEAIANAKSLVNAIKT